MRKMAFKVVSFVVWATSNLLVWFGGEVVRPSPEIGVGISILSSCILIAIFLWQVMWGVRDKKREDTAQKELDSFGRAHPFVAIVLIVLAISTVVLSTQLFLWDRLVEAFPSSATSGYENAENSYITIRQITFQDSDSPNGLLLEFGANFHDVPLDVRLGMSGDYKVLSEYWDSPRQVKRSADAQILTGSVHIDTNTIAKAWVAVHDTIPPNYVLQVTQVPISPTRSFYVVFQSRKPLSVGTARFGDKYFTWNDGRLISQE